MKPEELNIPKEASYNQAVFQMIRIHEIEKRIDENLIAPLSFDRDSNRYNYKKVLGDLYNLLTIVNPKLSEGEKKKALWGRQRLINFQLKNPVYIPLNNNGRYSEMFSEKNWVQLSEMIFEYRIFLSELMDKHGLGNPDKKNVGTSIIN